MRWLVLVGALGACSYPPPVATSADAERAGVALEDLARGRALLIQKCTGGPCHRTPLPRDAPATEWPHHVAEMAERAKLAPGEHQLIERYLVTLAK